jgi:pilus assembly protein Flp/PilA
VNVARPWSRIPRDRGSARRRIPRRGESGASAVEYGLLIAGIAAIIAVAVFAFGGGSTGLFQDSCKTIFADRSAGSCSE